MECAFGGEDLIAVLLRRALFIERIRNRFT